MTHDILVVDDDHEIQTAVALFLKEHGYRVTAAHNRQEALAAVAAGPVDLAVLDVDLGGEDGLSLLGELKATRPDLPVIVFTGFGYQEDLWERARAQGADAFTSKMLVRSQLLMDIRRVLRTAKAA